MRDFCKAALEALEDSPYLADRGIYKVFDPHTEPEKAAIVESLRYKGYIRIETLDFACSLQSKGVEYCKKIQEML